MPLVRNGERADDRAGRAGLEELDRPSDPTRSLRRRREFGATTLFNDITFTVAAGDRWGIVGRNGTGKTTLFRLLDRRDAADARTDRATARAFASRCSSSTASSPGATTVWEAAAGQFADLLALERSLVDQAARLEHDSSEAALDRYGKDLERFEREGGYTIAPRVDAVLHGLGFDPAHARTQSGRAVERRRARTAWAWRASS